MWNTFFPRSIPTVAISMILPPFERSFLNALPQGRADHPISAGLLCGRTEVKFRFIQAQRETFPVGQLCRVLEVSRSGFYSWSKRPHSERERHNAALLEHIHAVHRENRGVYGSPR